MNKTHLYFSIALMLWATGGRFLSAQPMSGDSQNIPSGPIQAGDFAAWRIDYVYPEDNKMDDATKKNGPPDTVIPEPKNGFSLVPPRQITITWAKPQGHAVIVDIKGNHLDEWSNGEYCVISKSSLPPMLPPTGPKKLQLFPDFTHGFPDTEWISSATFSGNQPMGGRLCLHFSKDDMQFWMDAKTHDPVQGQKGDVKRTYLRMASPSGPLDVPPDVAKVFAVLKGGR
jgi:hypothetical protein